MSIITYVPATGFSGVKGVVNAGSGVSFDVGAALVAGGGQFTVDSVTQANLVAVLDKFVGIVRSGSPSGSPILTDSIGPVIAHTGTNPLFNDVLIRGADGLYAPQQVSFSGGSSGNVNDGGAWSGPGTLITVHTIVEYGGTTWMCNSTHTTGSTFDDTKFTELSQYRGNWQANTQYEASDTVLNSGSLWSSNSRHVSSSVFSGITNWTQVAGGGGSGMSNPMSAANDIIIGGSAGTPTRLALGATDGMSLSRVAGAIAWALPPLNPVNISASSPVTGPYTLVAADAGYCVEVNSSSAVNITIPPSVFSAGQVLELFQLGIGQITVVFGTGVTFLSELSRVKTAGQNATIGIRFRTGGSTPSVALSGSLA